GGYTSCDVRYDRAHRGFFCPDNGARWTLLGSVLRKPGPSSPNDRLSIALVRISLDGHVLVSPDLLGSDPERDFELTGPGSQPAGAFGWCPDLRGTLAPTSRGPTQAASAALRFSQALLQGNVAAVRSMED